MIETIDMMKVLGRAWALREREPSAVYADLERTYALTPEEAQAVLLVAKALPEHPALAKTEPDVDAEAARLRTHRDARRLVEYEDAESSMSLPPERDSYTLASYRAEDKPPKKERIEQLQREGHRTALIAAYKTGKTTLHANLTAAVVDGKPFLGRFKVQTPKGRVGVWNAEMDGDDYEQYLGAAGVKNDARVAIWNLRGYRLPLLSDAGRDAAVRWLSDNEVGYWILDPWSRLCSWSGVDENVNAEVGPLLQRVDEIATEAGVEDLLVVHHSGYVRGRARGASVFSDYFDGLWLYERGEDQDRDTRFFRAEGRGIGVEEGSVDFDDGRTTYHAGGRRSAKLNKMVQQVVELVEAKPGITTTELKAELSGGNDLKAKALTTAVDQGLIRAEKADGRTTKHYPIATDGQSF